MYRMKSAFGVSSNYLFLWQCKQDGRILGVQWGETFHDDHLTKTAADLGGGWSRRTRLWMFLDPNEARLFCEIVRELHSDWTVISNLEKPLKGIKYTLQTEETEHAITLPIPLPMPEIAYIFSTIDYWCIRKYGNSREVIWKGSQSEISRIDHRLRELGAEATPD